jgi:hypothetical protein
LVQSSTYTSPK